MSPLLFSLSLLLAGGALSALLGRRPAAARAVFLASLGGGAVLGSIPALLVCAGAPVSPARLGWAIPGGELVFALDPLSALFLLLFLGVCLLSGIYGEEYIARSQALSAKTSLRPFYLIVTAGLAAVVCAGNALLFLLGWELMALGSFFLIIAEQEDPEVRRAGLLYFVCTHTATLALFLLFAALGRAAGTLDFEGIRAAFASGAPLPRLALPLAILAFGIKAGFAPLHIWLQEAHPAAPSHVSALMSGVVIKVGIYGFLRLIWMAGAVPAEWSFCLIAIGAVSGIGGVLFALAQHDLKRLLAYHSVENIGIIALGMGLGCLGLARGRPELALLGFSGAVLHTLNHGLFKSLLFLGSGAFFGALGTRDIEEGGGLLKRMPWTSLFSLVGAAAISGIPPLNGFVSEWLVYRASFLPGYEADARLSAVAAAALALIGGLALACFTKAYGTLCLGRARTPEAEAARDPGAAMLAPMAALAGLCVLIGLCPGFFALLAGRAAAAVSGIPLERAEPLLAGAVAQTRMIGRLSLALIAATAALALLRSRLLGAGVSRAATWGCGFTLPTARIQYTASSFAQPLARFFEPALGTRYEARPPAGYWPARGSFSSHTGDRVLDGLLLPGASLLQSGLRLAKHWKRSRLQYYLLYVSLFLFGVLIWKL